jgi:hypothetical protein
MLYCARLHAPCIAYQSAAIGHGPDPARLLPIRRPHAPSADRVRSIAGRERAWRQTIWRVSNVRPNIMLRPRDGATHHMRVRRFLGHLVANPPAPREASEKRQARIAQVMHRRCRMAAARFGLASPARVAALTSNRTGRVLCQRFNTTAHCSGNGQDNCGPNTHTGHGNPRCSWTFC